MIATASDDGSVRTWNATSGQLLKEFPADAGKLIAVSFHPNGQQLVTAGESGAKLWTVEGTSLREFPGHRGPVNSATFNKDGSLLLTASEDGGVRVFETGTGRLRQNIAPRGGAVFGAVFTPAADMIATGTDDGKLRLWRLTDGSLVHEIDAHKGAVSAVAVAPDGALLATCGRDGKVQIWDVRTQRSVRMLEPAGLLTNIGFSADGALLTTVRFEGSAIVWDLATGTPVAEFGADLRDAALAPDAQTIVTASSGDHVARVFACEVCVSAERLRALARQRVPRQLSPRERALYLDHEH